MHSSRIALIAATAIAALYGAGLYFEQNLAGPHCCGLTWPTPDPAQAERLMAKEDPKGVDPAAQRAAAVAVLSARPMESTAWLRLAYADRLRGAKLTDEGRRGVEMSYLVLPYAGPGTPWRLGFVLDNWSQITPRARQDALNEIEVLRGDDGAIKRASSAAAKNARDPAGQLAASLLGLIVN